MKPTLLVFASLLFICSCGDIEYNVDPIFEPYVEDFVEEARKNGLELNLREMGITIELSDVRQVDASGRCSTGPNQRHIVINKDVWQDDFTDFKRRLMFHELAHCVINRGHRNDRFDNGIWKSSMRGSPLTDAELQIATPYYGFRKAYYDEEIFNESLPDPEWADETFDIDEIDDLQKVTLVEEKETNRFIKVFSDNIEDYEIRAEFFFDQIVTSFTVLTWESTEARYRLQARENGLYYLEVTDAENTQWVIFGGTNAINWANSRKVSYTIQRQDNLEKLFINDEFVFHLDPLPGSLLSVSFDSRLGDDRINQTFHIDEITVSSLSE